MEICVYLEGKVVVFMFKGIFDNFMETMKSNPWYLDILMIIIAIVATLFVLAVILFILVAFVEVTKTAFACNVGAIAIIVYNCINEGVCTVDTVITVVLLIVSLLILLFLLCCNEDYLEEGIIFTIFDSLMGGGVNILILCAMGTIVLFPLAVQCWSRNDRY